MGLPIDCPPSTGLTSPVRPGRDPRDSKGVPTRLPGRTFRARLCMRDWVHGAVNRNRWWPIRIEVKNSNSFCLLCTCVPRVIPPNPATRTVPISDLKDRVDQIRKESAGKTASGRATGITSQRNLAVRIDVLGNVVDNSQGRMTSDVACLDAPAPESSPLVH